MNGNIPSNCASEMAYTGVGPCPKQEGKTSALIITPLNATYSLEKDTFITEMEAGVKASGSSRVYPVKDVLGVTINGGDINAPEVGTYGAVMPTNLNAKNVVFQINGGDCLYKELAKLNKRKVRVFRVDDDGYVYGTMVNGKFAGFEATLYATRTTTDGSTAYNLSLAVYYTPNIENEEKNLNAINVGLTSIPSGLVGLTLVKGSATLKARVVTACGGDDVTAQFGTEWSTTAFVKEGGGNPTSATYADGEITFDAAGSYRVAGASVLEGLDITGFDGIPEFVAIS